MKKQVLACLVTLAAAGSAWGQSQLDTVKVTGGAVQGVPNGNVVSFKGISLRPERTGFDPRWCLEMKLSNPVCTMRAGNMRSIVLSTWTFGRGKCFLSNV